MKNFKLLLATTAILSMGAMTVNAATTGSTVTVQAYLRLADPLTLEQGDTMYLGSIVPEANKKITVTTEGLVDQTNSDVKVVMEKFRPATIIVRYIGAGSMENIVAGMSDEEKESYIASSNASVYNDRYLVSIPDINMKKNGSDDYCGKVSNFTTGFNFNIDGKGIIKIGGTFTFNENPPSSGQCEGAVTATVLVNPAYEGF